MHFLSHYYTEQQNQHPLFVTSLIIPDLTEGFTKTYNSVISKIETPENENLKQIHLGILAHYAGDKKFHSSELFKQKLKEAINEFVHQGLDRKTYRLSVLAHLAIEMLIDRQIVLQYPSIATRFYDLLNQVGENYFRQYFTLHCIASQQISFLAKLRGFKQRKFLFYFTETGKIVFGLERVYEMATGRGFDEQDKVKFLRALDNIDEVVRYCWENLLDLKK